MAKVKAPLFSLAAWGEFGKLLVFQRRRGMATVYPYKAPKAQNTSAQLAQRASFASAISSWEALPGASKAWWNVMAQGMAYGGYHLYVQNYLLGLL